MPNKFLVIIINSILPVFCSLLAYYPKICRSPLILLLSYLWPQRGREQEHGHGLEMVGSIKKNESILPHRNLNLFLGL